MIQASCHCGSVVLEIDTAPAEVTECNCSVCRRYGALWAYYSPRQVRVTGGATDTYSWDDRSLAFHRCAQCGCVSHWWPTDPQHDRMGVNARLIDPALLRVARRRHLDGAGTETYLD